MEEFTALFEQVREKGYIIETKTVGLHTEVHIHDTIRNKSFRGDHRCTRVQGESLPIVFIRCAKEVLGIKE